MDWAAISNALTHLETLGPEDLALELERLGREDADLKEQIEGLRAQGESARFFMQTHMPDNEEAPANRLNPGDRLGIWEIGTLLGSGGMGEVYEARRADGLFEQRVALKLARNAGAKIGERFEAERQRLAQLEHPNIARIVDGGTTQDNAPYMTMEFVDGSPIDRHCRVAGLDRKARLNLVLKLCAAVSHAHGRLVLHRDIKHDNVLITAEGELRLIDFGVASLLDHPADAGQRGPVTFAYAAPEQLLGNPVSAATDIFAIGMLIHLLEAGSLPVRQSDAGVAIDAKRIADPDLAAVLAKATSFDPADRYGSVDALRDDLSSYLSGFAVAARPVSAITTFTKLLARNKLATAMGGAAIAAVIAGVIGVGIFAVRANDARAEAELRAEAAEYFLEEANYANEVARVSGNVS
ncbi:MAG: serine/threonine-protein kinase [Pseudomonadota bacterium]